MKRVNFQPASGPLVLAGGSSGGINLSSFNGILWTVNSGSPTFPAAAIASMGYFAGNWHGQTYDSTFGCRLSADGLTWTSFFATPVGNYTVPGLVRGATQWMLPASVSSPTYYLTSDMISFTGPLTIAGPAGAILRYTIPFGNGFAIVNHAAGPGFSGFLSTSPDGLVWSTSGSLTGWQVQTLHEYSGGFITAGQLGGGFGASIVTLDATLTTWNVVHSTAVLTGYYYALAHSGAMYVAVGGVGAASALIASSPDGVTWTDRTPGVAQALTNVKWSSLLGLFIASGYGGVITTSPDGITWTARTSGTTSRLDALGVR